MMSVSNIIYKIQTIANQGKVYICGCLRTTKRGDLISSSPSNVDGISGLMCTVYRKEPPYTICVTDGSSKYKTITHEKFNFQCSVPVGVLTRVQVSIRNHWWKISLSGWVFTPGLLMENNIISVGVYTRRGGSSLEMASAHSLQSLHHAPPYFYFKLVLLHIL